MIGNCRSHCSIERGPSGGGFFFFFWRMKTMCSYRNANDANTAPMARIKKAPDRFFKVIVLNLGGILFRYLQSSILASEPGNNRASWPYAPIHFSLYWLENQVEIKSEVVYCLVWLLCYRVVINNFNNCREILVGDDVVVRAISLQSKCLHVQWCGLDWFHYHETTFSSVFT